LRIASMQSVQWFVRVKKMVKSKTWLGYVLFALVAGGTFLYLCFPSDAVRQYLEGAASQMAPTLALKIDKVRPAFPFGLKLDNTDLGLKQTPGIVLFKADSFVLMPSIQMLALRGPAFRFACRAYGGNIQGVIAFKTFSMGGAFKSDVEMTNVRLDQYPCLKEWLKRELTGTMSGSLNYAGSPGSFLQGSGRGDLSILDGSFRFAHPFLGVESVSFDHIDARMLLDKQEVSLARFDFQGKDLEGKASGTIHVNPHFSRSSLDLRVAIKASSAFLTDQKGLFDAATFLGQRLQKGDFTMHVRGTIAQPRIDFI